MPSRRQRYLSAMGIDCWLPRQQLPGAAPGRVYVREVAQQAAAPQATPASAAGQVSSIIDSTTAPSPAARLQQELTGAAPKKNTIAPAQQHAVAQTAAASFQLAFYAWAPQVLIVDEVQDARLQQQLISNLLFALGHTTLQRKQPDYFEWPMQGGRKALELSPHEMVFGALQRMLEQQKPTHILLMGELAAQHVLGPDGNEFVPDTSLDASSLYPDVRIVGTYSSAALLENPLLKAETWQHLQSLRV